MYLARSQIFFRLAGTKWGIRNDDDGVLVYTCLLFQLSKAAFHQHTLCFEMADSQLEKAGDSSAAEAEAPVPAPAAPEPVDERYSAFTANEKRCIVGLVSYAAWFSTLSSFAYYPALPALSSALGVSTGAINLTVTTYMAVATVAPSLVGDAADVLGRRAMYLVTLGIYVVANAAIALSRSYAALLGLRVLQAAAISGAKFPFEPGYWIWIGRLSLLHRHVLDSIRRHCGCCVARRTGIVRCCCVLCVYYVPECEEAPADERLSITIAPSVGPILGGGLTFVAGWTWIFWFLCIASGVCLALMVFFLPETSRNLVGNGTVQPPKYLQLPFPQVMRHWKDSSMAARHRRVPNPLNSLIILARKDNTVVILACGFLYVIFTCINASLSTLFVSIYSLNQWEAGLIYLPFGLGGVASSFFSGRLMDEAYRHSKVAQGLSVDRAVGDDLDSFSVEKARLCVIWIPMLITTGSVVSFGWVLHYRQVSSSKAC